MNLSLSPNTQAILLLTAPLIVGRGSEYSSELLTLSEYNRLARLLRDKQCQPADLLGPRAAEFADECGTVINRQRLQRLLGRGFVLSQAVERWHGRAIWVVSRADGNYPKRLKARLKEDAPPILYGCGAPAILDTGGLAVVGSRHVDDALIQYTENVGRLSARAGRTIISGGARGIDQAAMRAALQADGTVIGVLADSLERAALNRDSRDAVMEGRLVLVSPYDPAAGFNVGHAMQRNKIVYSLADAALVVNSDFDNGGTWAGAVEQLERLRLVPIYVRVTGETSKGLEALLGKGASRWPEPESPEAFADAFSLDAHRVNGSPGQEELFIASVEEREGCEHRSEFPTPARSELPTPTTATSATSATSLTPAETLFATVRDLLMRSETAKTEGEVAAELQISKSQARVWLQRLVKQGALEKISKPTRYRAVSDRERLL